MTRAADPHRYEADVLVIGGGLAGGWAAAAAARAGASVLVVEKGYFGTSGVTATAGPSHWWVPPDAREAAIAERNARAYGLADPRWMARILAMTWRALPTLAPHYAFSVDEAGRTQYRGLRGPEYLRALRRQAESLGVTILDHHPALELLIRSDGAVGGARGMLPRSGEAWEVRAGAVVLATGGCAFASHLLGAANNTGDGLLMAVEAGADLSGMEFTNYYTVAPAGTNMTRSMAYSFARYFDVDDRELDIPPGPEANIRLARALLQGPVYCRLERVPQDIRERMPHVQPNFVTPFERRGVDPYSSRFEVTLRAEGTVRGIGGVRVVDDSCQSAVPGLFVAGDVATRELVAGATSGGGNQNSAWALSSGHWAGIAAARIALEDGRGADSPASGAGRVGMGSSGGSPARDLGDVVTTVREEMGALDRNMFRDGATLADSVEVLDSAWSEVARAGAASGRDAVRLREATAMLAAARWSKASALARVESRGMHQRTDAPTMARHLAARQRSWGLDTVWTRFETARAGLEAAE